MNVSSTRTPCRRHVALLALVALVALASLAATTPALAADGVPVFTTAPWNARAAWNPDLSGPILVWESSTYGDSYPSRITAYDIAAHGAGPINLDDPVSYTPDLQMNPAVLTVGTTVYVVFEQAITQDDVDLWIWRGSFEPASGVLTADAGFPKALCSGPIDHATSQAHPDIGLTPVDGVDHVVVAWEDDRATAPGVPEIYFLDLTTTTTYADPGWDPITAGAALDPTGIMGRGQRDPSVGATGIYWRDERLSYYNPDNPWDPTDTAIWRDSLGGPLAISQPFWTETLHEWDNQRPLADSSGAVWFRSRAGSGSDSRLWSRRVGGSGAQMTDAVDALTGDVTYEGADAVNFYVFGAAHGNAAGADPDIVGYDSRSRQRYPICNYSDGTTSARNFELVPTIGPAGYGRRVVWADSRGISDPGSDEEAQMNARLYQAFLPDLRLLISRVTVLHGLSTRLTATVAPNFGGAQVSFQIVNGATPFSRSTGKITGLHTVTLGKDSKATWSWSPAKPGTYYVRAWFLGGQLYDSDGSTPIDPKYAVPDVPAPSNLVKVVVK